jgi:hypothetical protein
MSSPKFPGDVPLNIILVSLVDGRLIPPNFPIAIPKSVQA